MRQIAAFLALACALAPGVLFADVFSPGELTKGHAHLEGLKNCTSCHGDGEKVSQAKCLGCHTEVRDRVREGKGFHGRLLEIERVCEKCHHDHQGRLYSMVQWVPSRQAFPHSRTGWPLEGKHREQRCDLCHQRKRLVTPEVIALVEKNPRRETYLGLPTRCSACHFDEHRGQLEKPCESCHGAEAWKPAKGFDHKKTRYALTGSHRKVLCAECHPKLEDEETPESAFPAPRAKSYLKLAPIAFQRCQDCHRDPHENKFGQRCESCHSTKDWRKVTTRAGDRGFHEKTRYPLEGLHAEVECKACHGPFPGIPAKFKKMAFEKCTDCHADAHLGQLAAEPKAAPCIGCHSLEGFVPARFELVQHAKTKYPLEAAHRAIACAQCHPSDPTLARKIPPALRKELARKKRPERFSLMRFALPGDSFRCEACHKEVHGGQFAQKVRERGCEACHTQDSFSELLFDHRVDSRFALEGKHLETTCESCHAKEKVRGSQVVRYRPLPVACGGCHGDVHAAQFDRGEGTACEKCHRPLDWKRSLFEHRPPFTAYLLDGKHAQAKCEACHLEVSVGTKKTRRYVALPSTCEGCHEDFHQGAFKGFAP